MASSLKAICQILFLFSILVLFLPLSLNAATTITYKTSTRKSISPQGVFTNGSGTPLTNNNATYGKLIFDGTLYNIGDYAFHNCSDITELTLPSTVKAIGFSAFSNLKSLTKPIYNTTLFARLPTSYSGNYTLPSTIGEIVSSAFKNCTALTGVTLPSTLKKIGESAFASCTKLQAITIPNNVYEIGHCAFWNCKNLKSVFLGPNPPHIDKTTFDLVNKQQCIIFVPQGSLSIYKAAEYWKDFENIIEISETAYSVKSNVLKLTGNDRTISFSVNKQADIKSVSFDIILPENIAIGNAANGYEQISRTDDSPLVLNSNCQDGVYEIIISNIKLTDIGGNLHTPKDYTFNLFIGENVKAIAENGVVSYAGDYSTEEAFQVLQASLPKANVVDLTKVTSIPEGSVLQTENPNMLIKTNAEIQLGNNHNVIINQICENLIIRDNSEFGTDQDFSAAHAYYERAMTSEWGSICLPFDVSADESTTFYTTGSVCDGILTLYSSSKVLAGQPAIFKHTTGKNLNVKNENATVSATIQGGSSSPSSINLFGAFTPTRIEEEGVYYIANDRCWLKTEGVPLNIKPFRAWFTIDDSNNSKLRSLSFEEQEEQTAGMKAIQSILEGKAQYFDETGRPISNLKTGLNIIELPDGTKQKILLK